MKELKSTIEKIDYSILKTLEKHPSWNPEDIVLTLVYDENPTKMISSKDNAKEIISTISREEIIKEIIKFSLKVAMADNKFGHLSGKPECIRCLEHLRYDKVHGEKILQYLEMNPIALTDISRAFAKIRYKNRKSVDIKGLDNYSPWYVKDYLFYLTHTDSKGKNSITSLKINTQTINKCREDICRGVQIKKDSVDYSLGKTMFASSNKGLKRDKQEDSVLLLRHPKNRNFKILVIADGVGGYIGGGEASRYTIQSIIYWFESLKEKYYTDLKALSKMLDKKIKSINEEIFAFGDGRGTTLVAAIVGKDETLIASVGDSRAYITKGNELIQVSRDDSVVQRYFERGYIKTKDDMRFHYDSNKVTQCIGMPPINNELNPNFYFLDNKDYDKIVLVSDGVSDCLSDKEIMAITTTTSREEIAKVLVNSALTTTSVRKQNERENCYYSKIPPGKDNTTAAVYSKTK